MRFILWGRSINTPRENWRPKLEPSSPKWPGSLSLPTYSCSRSSLTENGLWSASLDLLATKLRFSPVHASARLRRTDVLHLCRAERASPLRFQTAAVTLSVRTADQRTDSGGERRYHSPTALALSRSCASLRTPGSSVALPEIPENLASLSPVV